MSILSCGAWWNCDGKGPGMDVKRGGCVRVSGTLPPARAGLSRRRRRRRRCSIARKQRMGGACRNAGRMANCPPCEWRRPRLPSAHLTPEYPGGIYGTSQDSQRRSERSGDRRWMDWVRPPPVMELRKQGQETRNKQKEVVAGGERRTGRKCEEMKGFSRAKRKGEHTPTGSVCDGGFDGVGTGAREKRMRAELNRVSPER